MRKHIGIVMIVLLLLAFLSPLRVWAASGDGVRLDEGGTVTIVSQHAAKEGVSTLGFCLSVESANAAGVEFQFGESGAKIKDYRYDEATGSLKVYLAGTEALFASGTDALTVGKIKVLDGSGNEMNATVSVVENSLQYVYGTELKTMQGVELPGAVQIGPSVVQPQPPSDPQPPSEPQPPAEPQPPTEPQQPSVPQTPVVVPPAAPQLPVVLPTPRPAQTPRATEAPKATESPKPTQVPVESSQTPDSQPPESESEVPEESVSEDVPQLEEDDLLASPLPVDGKASEEDSKGVSIFVIIAVAAVLVVVIVEVMAFVVLKKPRRPKRGGRRGNEN